MITYTYTTLFNNDRLIGGDGNCIFFKKGKILIFFSYICIYISIIQFSSVRSVTQSVQLFASPKGRKACQASLSITNSQSLLKLMSIESVMLSNHLILCHPLHLLPSIFPSIRVFSNESVLCIRWPQYWSFSFSISPSS